MRQSDYADSVVSMKVVLPSGELVHITRGDESEYPLDAFTVSLGSLGVAVEIEMETVERRVFEVEKVTVGVDDLLNEYDNWNEANEFVKVWWFPETDKTHVWFVNEADEKKRDEFLAGGGKEPMVSKEGSTGLQETIRLYTSTMAEQTKTVVVDNVTKHRMPPSPPPTPESDRQRNEYFRTAPEPPQTDAPHIRTVTRFLATESLVAPIEQLLTKGIPVPQINCEIAIPLSHFRCALRNLMAWHAQTKYKMHYPFILRGCGASKAWLSPGFGEKVVWVGFLVYVARDGTVREDAFEMMREVQAVLRGGAGRPHWGKHVAGDGFWDGGSVGAWCMGREEEGRRDREREERWRRWRSVRERVDPDNKFLGEWVRKALHV